jgi:hypothetical protein
MSDADDRLPVYRLLTGTDDDAFCDRVSEALALGYELYGSPTSTFDGERVVVGQALVWPGKGTTPKRAHATSSRPSTDS